MVHLHSTDRYDRSEPHLLKCKIKDKNLGVLAKIGFHHPQLIEISRRHGLSDKYPLCNAQLPVFDHDQSSYLCILPEVTPAIRVSTSSTLTLRTTPDVVCFMREAAVAKSNAF